MTLQLVIESAIRTSVLGLGAWGLLRLLRIRSPAQERVAWLGVLIGGAVMPLAATVAHRLLPEAAATPALSSAIGGTFSGVDARPPFWPGAERWSGELRGLIWPVYLGVVAVLLARLGAGLFMLSWLWRSATPLPALFGDSVRVRSSCRVDSPVTIGAGILLPADWTQWSRESRERVLTHEKSHFMRGDFYWQLLARAYLAVFWVSPLSWWLLRRLTLLAEHLSDDAAVATHGGPVDYAALLMEFSNKQRAACFTVGMARRSELSLRVERLLRATGLPVSRQPFSITFVTGLLVLAVLSIAGPWFTVSSSPETGGPEPGRTTSGRPTFVRVEQGTDSRFLSNLPALSALPALRDRLRSLEPLQTDR